MATLLMIKERIKVFYAEYSRVIVPALKALMALLMLLAINDKIGYMARLDGFLAVVALTAVCAFLPGAVIVLVGFAVVLAHLLALSMEIALIALAVFLVMGLLYLRFLSKEVVLLVLVPLSFYFGVPYVMPLIIGVLCGPMSILTLCCGIVIHYYIDYISANALTIQGMTAAGTMDKVRVGVDGIIKNEAMFLALISFAAAAIVVQIVRRQAIDYAFNIAIFAGAMTNIILNFMGILVFDNGPSVFGLLLGSIVAVPVALLVTLLLKGMDYSRTERVQFEDADYYYYVKAVPKMNIQAPSKTVKKINTQRYQTHHK